MSAILGILMSIVLWLLAIVAGLLLLLFVVPFTLGARGWVSGLSAAGDAAFRWGFGFLTLRISSEQGIEVRLFGLRVYRTTVAAMAGKEKDKEKDKEKESEKKRPKEKGGKKPGKGFRLTYVRRLVSMVVRVLKSVRLKGWVAGVIGIGDPAETAAVAAVLDQLNGRRGGFTMEVTPDWLDERVDLQGDVRLCFWLPRTALVCIWILLDRENRRVLRSIG